MKKIIFGIIIYFSTIISVFATDSIDNYYMKIKINDDGSMNVRQLIIPFSDSSYNNGYEFDIYIKGDFNLFNGAIEGLKNSDIYNASTIKDLKVYEVSKNGNWSIDDIDNKENQYIRDDYAAAGEHGKYQLTEVTNGINLKVFNPRSRQKAFYIEYKINDVVVVHNDTAELFWPFIDSEYTSVDKGEILIELPGLSKSLKVWGHGDYTSEIYPLENKEVYIKISNHPANTILDARILFDTSLVPNATKKSNLNVLETILSEEKNLADEANKVREEARIIEENIQQRYKTMRNIFNIIVPLLIVGNIIMIIFVYKKHDKEFKGSFNNKYYRDFPSEMVPGVIEYLMKKSIGVNSLSAHILDLIRRKTLVIQEGTKKDIILKLNDQNNLNDNDKYLLEWLINDIGNNTEVSLKDIKKAASKGESFLSKYNNWKAKILIEAESKSFYLDNIGIKVVGLLYCIAVIAISIFAATYNVIFSYIGILLGLVSIVYFVQFTKRTEFGNDQYRKWLGLKRFMLDFGRMKEKNLPEIILWEKYLVYATMFGIADKVEKQMKIKINEYNYNDSVYDNMTFFYLQNMYIGNLSRQINSSITNAVSTATSAQIASSVNSSGSGSGGGFSGGGSFGGGGGFGGGGRGF